MTSADSDERPELVVALVAALGADFDAIHNALSSALSTVSYKSRVIKLSRMLDEFDRYKKLPSRDPYDQYIDAHQKAGDDARRLTGRGEFLALMALAEIRASRAEVTGSADVPAPATAYIIHSLKHAEEAEALRRVYGARFFLIAAYVPRFERVRNLARLIAHSRQAPTQENAWRSRAESLINTDEHESQNIYGQNVRGTFPKADFFVNAKSGQDLVKELCRFIKIIFAHQFITPTRDEYAMFHAKASSMRSADLSRQIGASICNEHGDVISVGTNEVPKSGGGMYWCDDIPDHRDFTLRRDQTIELRRHALGEVLERLANANWLSRDYAELSGPERALQAAELLDGTQVMGVNEYGRTVHAEMAAILEAARRGIPISGCNIYTTTFPCQNCARHIVAAGIVKIVYIEPYPKSLADLLHNDSIAVDADSGEQAKVRVEAFVGVSPRRFIEFFEMGKRRSSDGKIVEWQGATSVPKFHAGDSAELVYLNRESFAVARTLNSAKDLIEACSEEFEYE
jgi:deoxycytidylate deaminase